MKIYQLSGVTEEGTETSQVYVVAESISELPSCVDFDSFRIYDITKIADSPEIVVSDKCENSFNGAYKVNGIPF